MCLEKKERSEKVYREEGVALLVLRREETPLPPLGCARAEKRLCTYAQRLWREVVADVEEARVPALRLAYRENGHPKKRFLTRPLCIRFCLTYRLSDGILFFRRQYEGTLRSRTVFSLDDTLRFDAKNGFLLAEKKKGRSRKPSALSPKKETKSKEK